MDWAQGAYPEFEIENKLKAKKGGEDVERSTRERT